MHFQVSDVTPFFNPKADTPLRYFFGHPNYIPQECTPGWQLFLRRRRYLPSADAGHLHTGFFSAASLSKPLLLDIFTFDVRRIMLCFFPEMHTFHVHIDGKDAL